MTDAPPEPPAAASDRRRGGRVVSAGGAAGLVSAGLAGVAVAAVVLWFAAGATFPLDFDTAYYRGSGVRIGGGGPWWQESIIWTYLGGARSVPHPAFDYWMPLPAFGAAAGFALLGTLLSTVLAAAACAGLAASCLWVLTARRTGSPLAAWLAVAVSVALPGLVEKAADGDSPAYAVAFALLACTLLDTAFGRSVSSSVTSSVSPESAGDAAAGTAPCPGLLFGAGVAAGLAHLSRGDGLLVIAAVFLAAGWASRRRGLRSAAVASGFVAAGWLLAFGPWMARNMVVFGAPMPPGASAAVWIGTPDAMYAFAEPPTVWSMGGAHVARAVQHGASSVWSNLLAFVPWPVLVASVLGAAVLIADARRAGRAGTSAPPGPGAGFVAWAGTLTLIALFYATVGAVVGGSQRALLLANPFAALAVAVLAHAAVRVAGDASRPSWRLLGWLLPALLLGGVAWSAVVRLPAARAEAIEASDVQKRRHDVLAETLHTHFAGEVVMTASHSRVWFGAGVPTVALPMDGLQSVFAAARSTGATVLLLDGYGIEVPRPGVEHLHALYYRGAPVEGIRHLGDSGGYRVYRITLP